MSRRDGYLLSRRATLLAMTGLLLGMLLAALNQTIIATALPRIMADLGGVEHYSWVFTAYMLAATVTTPIYGRLSDIYGRRRFFATGIVLFIAGAIVGATAGSMTQLILARAVQGLGAGALIPLAIATIGDLIPPSERGRWQGLTGAVFGLASILGPTTGGWIADHADWRWVFLVSLPVGVVALAVVTVTLRIPPHPERGTKVDYAGAALLAAGLSSGLLATVRGGEGVGWGSAEIVGLYAASVLLLAVFVWWERRVDQPILPIELFRIRTVAAANLAAFVVGAAMFSTVMFVPLFAQGVLGASATGSGLVLTPLMLSLMLASLASGQVITRTGRYRWALLGGPLVMAASFVLMARLDAGSSHLSAAVAMVVCGVGIGMVMQNLVLVVQNSVPTRHLGAATAAGQSARTIGSTIGVAVMGAILTAGLPAGVEAGLNGAGAASAGATRADLAAAIHPVFVIFIPVMAVAFLLALLIPEVPLRKAVRDDVAAKPEKARAAMA